MPLQQLDGVCLAGAKHTTLEFMLGLERHGYRIGHCLTIDPETAEAAHVADYMDLRPFLRSQGIPFSIAQHYGLKSNLDRERISALQFQLLLVIGWQRLIPDWWLEALPCGAFGMHGSSQPLPHGRGRSPLNWSLITGRKVFYTHLIQYCAGVDDGPIAGVQSFDITPFDTCQTLHLKNTLSMVQLCARLLPSMLDRTVELSPQPSATPSYWPKRSPEHGLIQWRDSTETIYNLVRGVTKPFPGAFTFLDDDSEQKITIWRAIPFDTQLCWRGSEPGEILEVFVDGTFLVQAGDYPVLIQECDGHLFQVEDAGRRFGNAGTKPKMWNNLPA